MRATIDGNEAAASVAYRLNEVCCIYPITPSSPMAELADEWSSQRRPNVWGTVPTVVEMQSEGGAAGALHGALQGGSLATTFTASQGLLLMIPNMYKIAGELTSAVLHVAARSLAAQGLSIFGDQSDVMAVRQTGFALLASASVQEAHDLALVAQAATLATRVPFVHFFDGFRTSHELNSVEMLSDDDLRALVPEERVRGIAAARCLPSTRSSVARRRTRTSTSRRARRSTPSTPGCRQRYRQRWMKLRDRTGRGYRLVDYTGHQDAERVLVLMGSGGETARETVAFLRRRGERVGVLQVRLYRPFPARALLDALPPTVTRVAVLDRTKEPGSFGEPLFLDVLATLSEAHADGERDLMPRVVGGRYGLSSKEFTPAMVVGVLEELSAWPTAVALHRRHQRRRVPHQPPIPRDLRHRARADRARGLLRPRLGRDGRGEQEHDQDPRLRGGTARAGLPRLRLEEVGSQTVSHLRFGPEPISAPYLVSGRSVAATS